MGNGEWPDASKRGRAARDDHALQGDGGETSDPIAVRLLHDIIADLETELGDRNLVQVRLH